MEAPPELQLDLGQTKVRLAKRFGDAAMSGVDNANEESVTHAPRQALHE